MTEELRVAVDRKPNGAVLYTKGYINNVGGEEIANRAYELMDADVRTLLLTCARQKSSIPSASASSSRSSKR